MKLFTRRRVLMGTGGVVAAGAAGIGGFFLEDRYSRFAREPERTIPDHRVALPATSPRMVIARGGEPAVIVRAAIERLGGMRTFVGPEDVVVVKPNIGWNRTQQQAANTHPEVVAEIVRACIATGARRVIVSDCPVRKSRTAFERSGIGAAAAEAGAEVIIPEDSHYYRVQISERLGTWDILEPFVIATKIINVPVAKHHNLTGVTGGMKNWIGITSKLRVTFHESLQESIAELAALMRPTLTVIDATRVLMQNGPLGGSLDDVMQVGAVAAGTDPIALDAWACALLEGQVLPGNLEIGEKMGLGTTDYRSLSPIEITTG